MEKARIDAYGLLEKLRRRSPVVHHLTNWVTIYDCAAAVKALGASPVMAHAPEEAAEMAGLADALVLNIGTLTVGLVKAMRIAARAAHKKGIPVVLDACGCGATRLRDEKARELIKQAGVDILKGNASEVARLCGEKARTRGVDAGAVGKDLPALAEKLSARKNCTVVITGAQDFICGGGGRYLVKNGHPLMRKVVGTGCMAASIIGAFAAVEKNYALASAAGLVCFEVAAEQAAKKSRGPAEFKQRMLDCLYRLDRPALEKMQKVWA